MLILTFIVCLPFLTSLLQLITGMNLNYINARKIKDYDPMRAEVHVNLRENDILSVDIFALDEILHYELTKIDSPPRIPLTDVVIKHDNETLNLKLTTKDDEIRNGIPQEEDIEMFTSFTADEEYFIDKLTLAKFSINSKGWMRGMFEQYYSLNHDENGQHFTRQVKDFEVPQLNEDDVFFFS